MSVLQCFPHFQRKMRKCLTPDDCVVTPVGYFDPTRVGWHCHLIIFKYLISILSVLLCLPVFIGKFGWQIYKFFMTIPMLFCLHHIHIVPEPLTFSTLKVSPFIVLVLLLAVHVTSAVSS